MYLNKTFLFKILEGELWPYPIRQWRRKRAHIPHQRYLKAKQQHSRAITALKKAPGFFAEAERLPKPDETLVKELREKVSQAEKKEKEARQNRDKADHNRHFRDREHKYLPRRRRPLLTPADWRNREDSDWIPTYPEKEKQVMPTRVGNELKAMETYGANTYRLDSRNPLV